MSAISRIREAWSAAKLRLSIRRRFGRWSVPRASRVVGYDGEVLDYDSLREARLQAAAAARLDRFDSTKPRYPDISSTRQLAWQGFRRNSQARRCVEIICESASMARPRVVDDDGADAGGAGADGIRRLLEFPSGNEQAVRGGVGPILWPDLFWRYVQDLYLSGSAMWEWIDGAGTPNPVQVWRMAPERTYIQPHPERWIDHYVIEFDGKPFKIPRERVIHNRFWDPLDPFFGVPPLYSAIRALAVDNELIDHSKVTLQNLGVPPVALEFDLKELAESGMALNPYNSAEDRDGIIEMRDRFWEYYGGPNRGKPAVAFGYKIKLLGMDMAKLAVSDLITMSESRIASAMGVPMILLNRSAKESDPTRANFRQSREHFLTGTITSLLSRLEGNISPRLKSAFQIRRAIRLILDITGVDVLREQRLKRAREAGQVFTSGLFGRHTCQRLAGQPTEGEDEFIPVGAQSTPDRMPGDTGDGIP